MVQMLRQHPPHVSRATWSVFCLVDLTKPRNSSSETAWIKRALWKNTFRNNVSVLYAVFKVAEILPKSNIKISGEHGRILFDLIHFPETFRVRIVTLSCRNHCSIGLKTHYPCQCQVEAGLLTWRAHSDDQWNLIWKSSKVPHIASQIISVRELTSSQS